MQGHVDDTAECTSVEEDGGSYIFTFRHNYSPELARRGYFTVDKGSVTVNGVSLTVCNPTAETFQVCIIPYTYEHTNFHAIGVGTKVNIEYDILGFSLPKCYPFIAAQYCFAACSSLFCPYS